MATRIDLDTSIITRALTMLENSLKRSLYTPQHENPLMKEIINKDIAKIAAAKATLSEVK